jgi:hypothetical protein
MPQAAASKGNSEQVGASVTLAPTCSELPLLARSCVKRTLFTPHAAAFEQLSDSRSESHLPRLAGSYSASARAARATALPHSSLPAVLRTTMGCLGAASAPSWDRGPLLPPRPLGVPRRVEAFNHRATQGNFEQVGATKGNLGQVA